MTRKEKLRSVIRETYMELYANCTTPVSFDYLMENAELDENGMKKIPYDQYFIDEDLFDKIVCRNLNKMNMSNDEKAFFKFSVYMGCSPETLASSQVNSEPTE